MKNLEAHFQGTMALLAWI
jgi:hypothetical protein